MKKKTIIWEENSTPPRDYVWVKPDGKAYEYDYTNCVWAESKDITIGTKSEEEDPIDPTPIDPTPVDPTLQPQEDTSYQYLAGTKVPKYFWMYKNNEETKTKIIELFEECTEIVGNQASLTSTRLAVPFSKLNIGKVRKLVQDLGLGSIGFGVIFEKEDNFELADGDIDGIRISKTSSEFNIKFRYFDSEFNFDSTGLQEIQVGEELCYEYEEPIG